MQIGKSDMSPPIYGSVMFLPINVSVDDEKALYVDKRKGCRGVYRTT